MDFYAFYIIYIVFHAKKYMDRDPKKSKEEQSPYYIKTDDGEYKLDKTRMMVPIVRSVIFTFVQLFLILTFTYATKAGINQGIATTIFCSSLIFTAIYFYYKEG